MSDVDDLLREFRADLPGPAEGASERIVQRAAAAGAQPMSGAPAPRRRPARPLRWAALAAGVAAAATLIVAIAPTRDGSGAPTLLERAEAAIAPPHRIIELAMQVRSTTNVPGAVNPHRTINMREWTLRGAGRAVAHRILITEGPFDKSPTDEDSTMTTNRAGRIVDARSWNPLFVRARDNYDYPNGGGRGELEISRPSGGLQGGAATVAERLRDRFRSGRLTPPEHTAGGGLRFTYEIGDAGACSRGELVLDAQTLLPRRMVETQTMRACSAGGRPSSREVWTISVAKSLPATTANRRLLEIGDWPTARIVRDAAHGEPTPLHQAPRVPRLDEG